MVGVHKKELNKNYSTSLLIITFQGLELPIVIVLPRTTATSARLIGLTGFNTLPFSTVDPVTMFQKQLSH